MKKRLTKLLLLAVMLVVGIPKMFAAQTPQNEGIYYLYNIACTDGTPGFMSTGNNYGFQVVIDNFGFPLKLISTGAEDTYKFQFVHHNGYLSDDGWVYSDGDTGRARNVKVVSLGEGKYKLINTNNSKEIEDWYGNVVSDGSGNRHNYIWMFLSKEERDAMIAGYTQSQKLAAAASLGITLPEQTAAAFDSYISTNYIGVDVSSKIQNGTFTTSHNTSGWTTSHNDNRSFNLGWGNNDPKDTPEVYEGAGAVTQTVTVDKAGLYKVSVNATYRCGNNDNNNRIGNLGYDGSVAYLKANDNFVKISDWYSGKINGNGPNSPSEANSTYFSAGKYLSEVYVYVGEAKTIEISLHSHAFTWGGWFMFNNFKLTYYNDQVSTDDATEIIQKANDLKEKDMQATLKQDLVDALNAFTANQSIANYNVLDAALTAASTSVAKYEEAKEILDAANTLDATCQEAYAANETVAAIQTAYNAGTLEAVTEEQKAACNEALRAAFESTSTKATLAGDKKYLLKNIATGKYLSAGNNWGTQASLVDNAEYNTLVSKGEGVYYIDSQVSNGGESHFFNGSYMDGAATGITIYQKSTGEFVLTNGNSVYGWDGETTVLVSNLSIASVNALWQIVSVEDAIADFANATAESPRDATFLIEDHNFGRNNRHASAWTHSGDNFTFSGTNGSSGADYVNNVGESYHSTYSLQQTLKGLPNGYYRLYAQGFYEGAVADDLPYFFANSKKLTFTTKTGSENSRKTAGASFLKGDYVNGPIDVIVIDGELTIGTKNESNVSVWAAWDNFTLAYLGPLTEVTSAAELEATAGETVLVKINGLEVLNKDANGDIAVQSVAGEKPVGFVIKSAGNVVGASSAEFGKSINPLLLGAYDAAKHEFTLDEDVPNTITVVGNSSTANAMAIGTAANKESTYLLVKVENATIVEKEGAFYATNDNDEIKIDKRLDEKIKVNDGDLAYEIVGVTFVDGDVCVLAPLSKDAIVDNKAEAADGEAYDQGEDVTDVEGTIMLFGGDDPNGAQYEFVKVDQEVNSFATMTKGLGQLPVDAEGQAFDKELMNLPTTGTYYKFIPTKDGQLNVTVGLEKGKTLVVAEEEEVIKEEKQAADLQGVVSFPVEATKTYYVFAIDADLEYYGFTFTPANIADNNVVKDIATFKMLREAEAGKADRLQLNDAVVTYIKGDNVFVEDASGAIDFFETGIQFYVGQVLNGYIEGSNGVVDNMPVLKRVDGHATFNTFQVTDKITPEAKTIATSDAVKEENLARFAKLEYVELTSDKQGLRVLADLETGESVRVEDHFNVLYEQASLYEKIEGIVGIDKEGTFVFWPTSKDGVVISDGYKKVQETELDVTNKDQAKSKNNPVVGVSITLDGACNAGSGSAMAGAMTSKGYKLRTANGSPVANSATFTVNEGKTVYGMVINGVGNYKAKDETLPLIKVTKVEVDGDEVSFEGGEFPAKGASDCGTLTLKGIKATQSIVLYFDNSNAEGTQINIAYAVTYNGEKIYTNKELSLIEEAKELAQNRDAIAVGCLDDAIEAAEAGNTEGLQKAIDQFKADNATSSIDCTDKVGKDVNSWKNVQECPANEFKVYNGGGVSLVQVFGVTGDGDVLTQEITGLENGTYNIAMYATSHNAWDGVYGENKAGKPTLQEDANDVAYVFGTSGTTTLKTWITARRNSGLIAGEPEVYEINGMKIDDGKLTIGLALAQAAKTEWHSVQIASLKMVTTAKEAYAAEKANLQTAIDDAETLLAGDQIGGKANLQAAVDAAKEALVSIRLNVSGMANEVTKLRNAIDKFHAAGKVFVQNVATGKYLGAGSEWGTHAVLDDTGLDYALTTNSDGTKNFDSQVSNGGAKNFLNDVWNDGEAFGWTVSQLSNGNYTISNGTQYLSAGDDNIVVLSDNADEWRFITVDERKETLATATSSAPVDATFLIKGANFNRNDKRNNSWTVSADCTNKNLSGGNNLNNCAESYHSTFTISQIVEDAPAGTYTLTAQGFYRQDDGATEDVPVFFANEETKAFGPLTGTENNMTQAGESFTAGLYALETITVVVAENGTLTIGTKGTGTHQWVIWDNFQLKYYGNGGTPTAISETVAEPVRFEDGAIYNLRGQKVTGTLKPGMYIKNGKKIVIK